MRRSVEEDLKASLDAALEAHEPYEALIASAMVEIGGAVRQLDILYGADQDRADKVKAGVARYALEAAGLLIAALAATPAVDGDVDQLLDDLERPARKLAVAEEHGSGSGAHRSAVSSNLAGAIMSLGLAQKERAPAGDDAEAREELLDAAAWLVAVAEELS